MTRRTRRSVIASGMGLGAFAMAGCIGNVAENTPSLPNLRDGSDDDPSGRDGIGNDLDLPGESIDGFEDLDVWNSLGGSASIEPVNDDAYSQSQSARVHADAETEFAGVFREFSDPIDLSGKNVSLAIKYTGRDMLNLTVQLIAPNSRNYLSLRRTLTGPPDRWVRVDLGVNYKQIQPDLSDVTEIQIIGRRRGDESGPIEFSIDDLRAVDRSDDGRVMLLFDGTLAEHYTTAFEIMQEYGYAGVETVIPEVIGSDGRLFLRQMREMRDEGWDMIARPRVGGNYLHEFSREEQDRMIRGTKSYLVDRGFPDGARHFFTPRNLLSSDARDLVTEHHEQAFSFGGAPNSIPATDPFSLGHFSGTEGSDTEHFIDMAATYNQLAILHFSHLAERGLDEDAFSNLLDYIDERDVTVTTATELLDLSTDSP